MVHVARNALDPPAAPGPDRRADEVDRADAAAPQPRLQAEVEVGRIDADEGTRPLLQQALGQRVADARRSRASGAAHRRTPCTASLWCGHQASKPCAAISGPPMPTARSPGQRCAQPPSSNAASRSPEASPATIAQGAVATSICRSAHDAALRRGQEVEHQRRRPPPTSVCASGSSPICCVRLGQRQARRYSSRCICLTTSMRSAAKPRRLQPFGVDALGLAPGCRPR